MAELTLVPRRTPPGVAPEAFHVRNQHATLGRGAQCDWVLSDPQRLLSKRHCEVAWRNGIWTVTDLSSNGTTLGGKALTRGEPHELRDGDRIGCGNYEMDVVFGQEVQEPSPYAQPQQRESTSGQDPLAAFSNPFEGDGVFAPPVTPDHKAYGRAGHDGAADPMASFFDDEAARSTHSSEGMAENHQSFDFSLGANEGGLDFGKGTASGDVSSVHPQTSGIYDSFAPPRPTSQLLPEDWNEPDHGHSVRHVEKATPEVPQSPFVKEEPVAPHVDPTPAPEAYVEPPVEPRNVPDVAQDYYAAPEQAPPSAHVPASAPEYYSEADGSGVASVAAFMRGAALEGLPSEAPEVFFEELGRTFRSFVIGLRRAMIARAEVKGEFRIDQTMIQPFGNNPLKFAVDDDDALSALLGVGRRTGVSSPDAVADALRDIQIHEMALTRSIEPSVREFMALNGPDAVLETLSFPKDQSLSLFRRAKAWTAYVQHTKAMAETTHETLDGAFGRAFGRIYEAARAEIEAQGAENVRKKGRGPSIRRKP
ncbi:type VI secretion system-associated FHA domain protein TagH [Swingsia samuiensis]|uniref:Type VI secretion system-associated FHA domain protein TagH n=1 Tax=Swingsia samuiensis TaxID=1293412 RepID=A0A4Y6UIW3_9PROT|nr:type VI secretion system-associated FHA domain protein TagH [Swingsia samuiensis]QDH16321.1 type VI secretion system-associated FHA domain protein TagH [Swingsia samuiensis]